MPPRPVALLRLTASHPLVKPGPQTPGKRVCRGRSLPVKDLAGSAIGLATEEACATNGVAEFDSDDWSVAERIVSSDTRQIGKAIVGEMHALRLKWSVCRSGDSTRAEHRNRAPLKKFT
jgi:hypothetical protein